MPLCGCLYLVVMVVFGLVGWVGVVGFGGVGLMIAAVWFRLVCVVLCFWCCVLPGVVLVDVSAGVSVFLVCL